MDLIPLYDKFSVLLLLCIIAAVNSQGTLQITPAGDRQIRALTENIYFECSPTYMNNPNLNPYLRWYDNRGIEVTNVDDTARIHIERDGATFYVRLYISNIKAEDAGNYTCMGTIDGNRLSKSVYLDLYKDITFDEAPTLQYPTIYTNALIMCRVSGNPVPTVSWKKDGGRVLTSGRFVINNEGLRIINVSMSDGGLYTCRAEETTRGKFLTVDIRVEVHVPPSISHPVGFVEGVEGQQVAVSCKASGVPEPKYDFYYNDEKQAQVSSPINPLDPSNIARKFVDPSGGVITFNPLYRDDQGNYTCIATNDAGFTKSSGYLHVIVKPYIYEYLNVSNVENRSVSLKCLTEGDPPPEMYFRKIVGSQVTNYRVGSYENGRVVVEQSKPNQLVYRVNTLTYTDTANYTCVCTNLGGIFEKNGTILVEFAPRFEEGQPMVYYGWLDKVRNISCQTLAEPNPAFQFIRFGRILPNNETFHIFNLIKVGNLQIFVHDEEQSWIYGKYTCRAWNAHGEGRIDYEFRRAFVPSKVTDVTIKNKSPTTVTITVAPPEDNGGNPVYQYEVRYDQSTYFLPIAQKSLYIEKLRPSTNYVLQVRARNEVGLGQPFNFVFQTDTVSAPSPPSITSTSKGLQPYQYNLLWNIPETGGAPILEYRLNYQAVIVDSNNQVIGKIDAPLVKLKETDFNSEMRSYLLEGLRADTAYQIQVEARNDIGWSAPSLPFIFHTYKTSQPGVAPGGLVGAGWAVDSEGALVTCTLVVCAILSLP